MGQNEVIKWLKYRRDLGDDRFFSGKDIIKGMVREEYDNCSTKFQNVYSALMKIRSTKNSGVECRRANKLTARDNWILYRYKNE